jgi:hypothetical protein
VAHVAAAVALGVDGLCGRGWAAEENIRRLSLQKSKQSIQQHTASCKRFLCCSSSVSLEAPEGNIARARDASPRCVGEWAEVTADSLQWQLLAGGESIRRPATADDRCAGVPFAARKRMRRTHVTAHTCAVHTRVQCTHTCGAQTCAVQPCWRRS